jgi:hypothetical protein
MTSTQKKNEVGGRKKMTNTHFFLRKGRKFVEVYHFFLELHWHNLILGPTPLIESSRYSIASIVLLIHASPTQQIFSTISITVPRFAKNKHLVLVISSKMKQR